MLSEMQIEVGDQVQIMIVKIDGKPMTAKVVDVSDGNVIIGTPRGIMKVPLKDVQKDKV